MLLAALALPVLLNLPPLTEAQVYRRTMNKLKDVRTLSFESHEYEKGKYKEKYGDYFIDLKRGYHVDGGKWKQISDLKRQWSRYATGESEVKNVDRWEINHVLGFDIIPDRGEGECFDNPAKKLMFDKRMCYAFDPKYGESPMVSYTIYVDAKTFLPAGSSESQMGESSCTYAYRKVKLNPRLKPSLFVIPRK
jgi:hypothetical protein